MDLSWCRLLFIIIRDKFIGQKKCNEDLKHFLYFINLIFFQRLDHIFDIIYRPTYKIYELIQKILMLILMKYYLIITKTMKDIEIQ